MPDQRRLVDMVEYAGSGTRTRTPASRTSSMPRPGRRWRSSLQAIATGRCSRTGRNPTRCISRCSMRSTTRPRWRRCRALRNDTRPSAAIIRPAIRLERSIRDLYGLEAEHAADRRPWIDHGCWDRRHPLARQPDAPAPPPPYPFLSAEGHGLHQIAVGPVHAGIIEPGHFRFSANGETVVRLEERLGYVHKGIESLWCGSDIERAAQLAARVSGDSTVASSIAFARAVEAALGVVAPARAQWLRGLMAELERIANHLGDIGAVCNDASFTLMHAHCGVLRERVLRACGNAFGHRLMMDRVIPGGVSMDPAHDGIDAIRQRHRRDCTALSKTRRAVRRHAIASGSNGRHRRADARTRPAVWRRRLRRPRVRPGVRRTARTFHTRRTMR